MKEKSKKIGITGQIAHVKSQKTTYDAPRRSEGTKRDNGQVTNGHVLGSKVRR